MIIHNKSLGAYLQVSPYIDYLAPQIQTLILSFKEAEDSEIDRIKMAFEYVRDKIAHSYDIKNREVTRTASEALEKKHGICYAKSHLLAAVLRGMGIPAGISYQRLTLYDKPEDGFCVHALNTVYLREFDKWIRLDPRGNKEGIEAQFSIDEEKLAFPIRPEYGELDYLENYDEPHPDIIKALENNNDCLEMYQNDLPEHLRL
jgi:transglutaminase-like putative cysteine protease